MLKEKATGRRRWEGYEIVFVMVGLVFLLEGCTAKGPSVQEPTQREIRSDSDRFFEKMRQEEREHSSIEGPAR